MKKELISASEIEQAKNNEEFIRKTAEQVSKDFGMFGLDIEFPERISKAYPLLMGQLATHLENLLNSQHEKLRSLLYQIDISEPTIYKAFDGKDTSEHPQILAHMVLERELKKVLLRHYFSNL